MPDVTDKQIERLRSSDPGNLGLRETCDLALRRTKVMQDFREPSVHDFARARCREIINARAKGGRK